MQLRNFIALGVTCVGLWSLHQYSQADSVTAKLPEAERARRADVMKRHEEELRNRPDVLGLLGSTDEIIIVTDSPTTLPTEIEGVPVKTVPPTSSRSDRTDTWRSKRARGCMPRRFS